MPTFNRASLVRETIDSIRNQTCTDWELLIMDDGSDDDTAHIVEQVHDERIRYYFSGRTGHVSRLKNTAITMAGGEFIAFIDSDDLWAPDKLAKQLDALEQYRHAAFCVTGGYTFNENKEPVTYLYKQRNGLKVGDFMLAMFRSELSGFTQALLFRKTCITNSVCFDETKPFSDPDFILNLASLFTGVIIYEPLFFRRLHEMSDSHEFWENRYVEWAGVIESYRYKKQLPSREARAALFKLYINFGEKYLLYKEEQKAAGVFFRAWTNKPLSIVPLKKIVKSIWYTLK